MSTKERRVTLALKWKHLDNLEVSEIRDRFEEEGIGDYAESTIRGYLSEEPAEEVLEMIEQEHANTRLQIAEREERMYQRAREAESKAVEDQPIKRVVPQTKYCKKNDGAIEMPAWEFVDPGDDDWPDWAEEDDVIIRFLEDETRLVEPGDEYPLRSFDGSPRYTTEFVGLERDVDDLQGQAMARQEQSSHLKAKGDVLGVYQENINLSGEVETSGEFSVSINHHRVTEADLEDDGGEDDE
ncbi:hypothetical protein [Natrarchaeobaculum sulfurireducens]|uniref:Uncharacterized protein n=1 Tax=Natrarchaeobaculum sulfurireducens TaxID=2044521 RepID=A0A346PMQ3_9EURY|nr:hypothetical protein [Natrarchaeobaculum sulfurireducens]AXR80798.1 hypothetical protein AArcMg_0776 [Natrarchaeobaculum sulfurireducens]